MNIFIENFRKMGLSSFKEELYKNLKGFDKISFGLIKSMRIFKFAKNFLDFEENIGALGLNKAAKALIDILKIKIITEDHPPNKLQEKTPFIILTNHDVRIEAFLLSSMIKRNDIFFLGGTEGLKIGENASKHVLPIKPRRYSGRHSLLHGEAMTDEEIKSMNEKSYKEGANKLEKGAVVGIFPTGGKRPITESWFNGIGYLVASTSFVERDKIYILPVYFDGLKKSDFLELITEFLLTGEIKKERKVRVRFGNPVSIKEIIGNEKDPVKIKKLIQDYYIQ